MRRSTPPPSYREATADSNTAGPESAGDLKSRDVRPAATPSDPPADTAKAEKEREAECEAVLEETLLDKATAFAAPPPGQDGSQPRVYPRLVKPVVVPRLNPGPNMPFARGWAPCLAVYDLDQTAFLTFIDNLNLVTAPHPAVKILELTGFGLQFAPLPYADALAAVMQVTAAVATIAVAQYRGRRYLARLNATFFEPRGLHAALVGTRKLKACLGVAKEHTLLAPLAEETLDLSAQQRCLRALETWAAALETEAMPPPSPETNLLARYTAWRIRSEIRKADRKAARSRRRAWKRYLKGRELKEGWGEKSRVKRLSWIVLRNLDDVVREREEAEAAKAAKKRKRTH